MPNIHQYGNCCLFVAMMEFTYLPMDSHPKAGQLKEGIVKLLQKWKQYCGMKGLSNINVKDDIHQFDGVHTNHLPWIEDCFNCMIG